MLLKIVSRTLLLSLPLVGFLGFKSKVLYRLLGLFLFTLFRKKFFLPGIMLMGFKNFTKIVF